MSLGATWVLLRGLTREQRHWGAFPQAFGDAVQAARVVTLDLPGNGTLNHEVSPWRVDAMVAHCRAQLRARGLAPPYSVLAMSLGAMVATDWAARHPHELDAAVLINTSMRPFSPLQQRLLPSSLGSLLRLVGKRLSARERERIVMRLTSRWPDRHEALLADWAAWRRERPVSAANALRQLVAAARFEAPRHRPLQRMLVLTSAGDSLVDTRCSQALARHWACAIARHPSAGHDLPLDDGAWVIAQVIAQVIEQVIKEVRDGQVGGGVPHATPCEG